jgi:isopentenyl-diphosphate delta-isomerase
MEELGFATPVEFAFSFIYKATLDNALTEYEYDHVLVGKYDGDIKINTNEVGDYCYRSMDEIKQELSSHPGKYTAWFLIAFPMLEEYLATNNA